MRHERYQVDEISAINVYGERAEGRRPVVMILHGAGSTKESVLPVAERLAALGLFAVAFDACGYGESPVSVQDARTPMDLFYNYQATSGYINRLIGHLADHPQADAGKVGLTGFSMGAHVIYYYLAHERIDAVKAAAAMSGSPRWDNIARRFATTMEQFKPFAQEVTILQFEREVKAFHPLPLLEERLRDFPLFMSTGELDEKALAEDVTALYRSIADNYSNRERIKLTVYPGIGHTLTEQMMQDGLGWLLRFLRE